MSFLLLYCAEKSFLLHWNLVSLGWSLKSQFCASIFNVNVMNLKKYLKQVWILWFLNFQFY